MSPDRDAKTLYKVVINHEGQYSIWPSGRNNAPGWQDAGKSGTQDECLDYIKEVWTDMRPLSLRQHMEAQNVRQAQQSAWSEHTSQSTSQQLLGESAPSPD